MPLFNTAIKAAKNNDSVILNSSTVAILSCKSEHTNKIRDSSKTVAKSLSSYSVTTKEPDVGDLLFPVLLIESIHNYRSKRANIKDKDNTQDRTSLHIRSSKCQ